MHFVVWNKPRSGQGPGGFTRYASKTCLNHLKYCPHQSLDVRQRAQAGAESPKKPQRSPYEAASVGTTPVPGTFSSGSRLSQMLPPSLPLSTHFGSPTLDPNQMLDSPSIFALSPFCSTHPSPLLSALPSPVTGALSLPYASHPPTLFDQSPAPTPQLIHTEPTTPRMLPLGQEPWSSELQAMFEARIARLTASAGLPLSWVDNPEWIDFVHQFLPWAVSPSRKVLTTRLIPRTAKSYHQIAKGSSKGQNATIQADGWTGLNFHHLLAFMITVNKKVGFTFCCLEEFS